MNQHTITVDVDDEKTEVTLTQPQGMEYMHTVATMPESFAEAIEQKEYQLSGSDAKWLNMLASRTADLTDEQLDLIAPTDVPYFIESCCLVLAGQTPRDQGNSYRIDTSAGPFEDMDLNPDGSVDRDDWR